MSAFSHYFPISRNSDESIRKFGKKYIIANNNNVHSVDCFAAFFATFFATFIGREII